MESTLKVNTLAKLEPTPSPRRIKMGYDSDLATKRPTNSTYYFDIPWQLWY